jgi:pyrophosphate--fructose-6-phosphate 1-phosphotransferase
MKAVGCVNIFVSEGACVDAIASEMESRDETIERDTFGYVKLDSVNLGEWCKSQFARKIESEKALVQKSGYFARSAPSNLFEIALINDNAEMTVKCAIAGESGSLDSMRSMTFKWSA